LKNVKICCPACSGKTRKKFSARILCQFEVDYYECLECGLIQTEAPFWLEKAYSSAITNLDVGLVARNIQLSELVQSFIGNYFDPCGKYLDFAGGYGLFVRLMRDKGYDFYRHDRYCVNIFAEYFDIPSLSDDSLWFELITAFEVLEHIIDPFGELKRLFELTDSVLFTTELIPPDISEVDDWWYFVPETGQHITFYSEKSLRFIADQLSANYYGDGKNRHLFSKKRINQFSFLNLQEVSLLQKIRTAIADRIAIPKNVPLNNENISTQSDFEFIRNKIGYE
jgi:hypothetical protein